MYRFCIFPEARVRAARSFPFSSDKFTSPPWRARRIFIDIGAFAPYNPH